MTPFRSEIRNSPSQQTIKIFLSDESLDKKVKKYLEHSDLNKYIERIEIRETLGQNRADENITVFLKDSVNINTVKASIDSSLVSLFE